MNVEAHEDEIPLAPEAPRRRPLVSSRLFAALGVVLLVSGCSFSTKDKKPKSAADEKGEKADASDSSEGESGEEESEEVEDETETGADGATASTTKKKKKKKTTKPAAETPSDAPAESITPTTPRPKLAGEALEAHEAGRKAFKSGDLAGAKKQFDKAIAADADAYEAHYARGLVLERQGSKDALAAYKQSFTIVPDYEPAIVSYALLLAKQGNAEGALSFLREKQGKIPNSAAVLGAMAEVKSLQGESGEAQRLAQEALKKNPDYRPAMLTLARDHYRARRIDLALYALQGILDGYGPENPPRDKNGAEARLLRGIILAERGARGPAMEDLEKAVELRPDLVEGHLLLARFMMEAGNAKEAAPHLETAIRFDAKNVAAHLMLGDAYRLLDRGADARKQLEWVIAADPAQVGAHYNLGLLFLMSSKLPGLTEIEATNKAIEHLEAYKAKAPRGGPDDVDELITRAKSKKALLEAAEAEKKEEKKEKKKKGSS